MCAVMMVSSNLDTPKTCTTVQRVSEGASRSNALEELVQSFEAHAPKMSYRAKQDRVSWEMSNKMVLWFEEAVVLGHISKRCLMVRYERVQNLYTAVENLVLHEHAYVVHVQ